MTAATLAPKGRLSASERRRAIVAAAKRVFAAAGYHQATTRDIAAAAGVSEGLLYQHFAGKRQLFEAVIEVAVEDLERRLLKAREGGDEAVAGAFFDFVEEESDLYRVFFRQALQADPALRQLHREICERLVRQLYGGVQVSALGVHALSGMLNELALWWVEERQLPKSALVRRTARLARFVCQQEVVGGAEKQV